MRGGSSRGDGVSVGSEQPEPAIPKPAAVYYQKRPTPPVARQQGSSADDEWAEKRRRTRLNPNANIIAGGVAGASSLVVGYPFDTVKVKLQTASLAGSGQAYTGAMQCFRRVLFHEGGFLSLYRGMAGLLCFSTPRFALIFHGNALGLGVLGTDACWQVFAAGAASQLAVVPLVVAPCERIKVLLQTQPPGCKRGQLECLREVVARHGLRKGLCRGTMLTYARDVPSFATYFATYEFVRASATSGSPPARRKESLLGAGISVTLLAGASAGLAGWMVAIPFDAVKNRHQAELSGSAASTVSKLWKSDGVSGFFRGAAPILARAVPANAAAFLAFELVISSLAHFGKF